MSDVDELANAIVQAVQRYNARLDRENIRRSLLGMPDPIGEDLEPIAAALEKSPKFRDVANWYMYSNGDSRQLTIDWLARFACPFPPYDASQATERAVRIDHLLQVRQAAIRMVTLIWGVKIDRANDIGGESRLVPFEDFRDVSGRQVDDQTLSGIRKIFGAHSQSLIGFKPTVLIATSDAFPFLVADPLEHWAAYHTLVNRTDVICRALVTFGSQSPVLDASWFEYADQNLNSLWFEVSRTWRRPEVIASDIRCVEPPLDKFVQAIGTLPADSARSTGWQRRMVSAMKRFELCLARRSPGDQAIDMCIAYEQILDSGGGWKNGFRCAALLGGDLRARLETREIINGLYDIRNGKVHGSDSVDVEAIKTRSLGEVRPDVVLQKARAIFAEVLFKLLPRQNKPDWFEIETRGQAE